jgi:hypothetical protein
MTDSLYSFDPHTAEQIDERLRRLEAAVAALSDTHLMEDRVAERVAQRLKKKAVVEANGTPPTAAFAPPAPQRGWLLPELWGEVRTLMRMFGDHRYPFSFSMRLGPLTIGVLYVIQMWTIGLIPVVGWFFERIIEVVLAFMLYKILSREVARYRAMFPVK